MLVNKLKVISIVVLTLFSSACKEKAVVRVTEPYVPTRSDYIIAVNKAYLTAADSASNQTRLAIISEVKEIPITLDPKNQAYIDLYKALGDSVKEEIIYTQLKTILGDVVDDLQIPISQYLKIDQNTDLRDLLQRNILTRKYVFMKQFEIAQLIENKCMQSFQGSRADVLLRDGQTLYQQYYNTQDTATVSFSQMARSASLYFMKEMERQENIAKKNYRLWDNKQAVAVMQYLEKN